VDSDLESDSDFENSSDSNCTSDDTEAEGDNDSDATTLCFKKVHRLLFTITKSDVDRFR